MRQFGVQRISHPWIEPLRMENPYEQPQNGCILCNITVYFKNVQLLAQFISPHTGIIYGIHVTGENLVCGKKQRVISKAIKKANSMGFMSVTHKDPHFMKDPNIFDIRHLEKLSACIVELV